MEALPKHVAIVMDGNGRWASQRNWPRVIGHRNGAKVVRTIVEYAAKRGISVLTLFAFSLENRSRPLLEVDYLMTLFVQSLRRYTHELHENQVRLRVIGERHLFDAKLLALVAEAEQLTAKNTGLTLVIAVHYSGRWDITQAARQLAERVEKGELKAHAITTELFQQQLCLADLPEPDLLIRTGYEQRISNFMLWQFAYTELFFSNCYWPEFTPAIFDEALNFYATRQRRFGLTPDQVADTHV